MFNRTCWALMIGAIIITCHGAMSQPTKPVGTAPKEGRDPMNSDLEWHVYTSKIPIKADALRYQIEVGCAMAESHLDPRNPEDWEKRRPEVQARLAEALGLDPMPEKTPLNAQVTGRTEFEHYTLENVVFESLPRFYVPANLYIPKGVKLPAPAVLYARGHGIEQGKNARGAQTVQINLARHGFVVLCWDPIGQGERLSPGNEHVLGYQSLLVGQTNEGMIIWDTIRAIDYLCERPEVDSTRIGITGNSGGGETSVYAPPFDERIKAAAACGFPCSYHGFLERGGSHCICCHLPGMVKHFELFEVVGLIAPRPFLMESGSRDGLFPIDEVRWLYERAKRIYEFQGAADRIKQMDWPLPHSFARPLREAGVGWLARWLQDKGDGSPLPQPEIEVLRADAEELQCFKDGQLPADAETMVTLNRKRAAELIEAYATPPETKAAWEKEARRLRRAIWSVFGGKPAAYSPVGKPVGTFEWEGRTVERIALATEGRMEVPALLIHPPKAPQPRPVVIFVDEKDKLAARTSQVVAQLLDRGVAVLAMDPRGTGEIETHINQTPGDAVALGRPLLAQRTWDVMQAAKYLAGRDDVDADRISCYGQGASGLLALFAAALDDTLAGAATEGTLASFAYAIRNGPVEAYPYIEREEKSHYLRAYQQHYPPLWIYVPNMLKAADVPQVLALALPKTVICANPVGYERERLSDRELEQAMSYASNVAETTGASSALTIETGSDTEVAERVAHILLSLRRSKG